MDSVKLPSFSLKCNPESSFTVNDSMLLYSSSVCFSELLPKNRNSGLIVSWYASDLSFTNRFLLGSTLNSKE